MLRSAPSLPAARAILAAAGLVGALAACDDSTGPDDASLVGIWNATSLTALGNDFIEAGMGVTLTLTDTGTYTVDVENDLIEFCDPGPDCSFGGAYTSTDTQITLDPDTEDEVTFAYTIDGDTMVWSGTIEGVPANFTFER